MICLERSPHRAKLLLLLVRRRDLQQRRGSHVSAGLVASVRHGRGQPEVFGDPGLRDPHSEGLLSGCLDGVEFVAEV